MKTRRVAPATTADYRVLAERRLPRFLFDYIDGGANEERTMAANCDDFGNYRFRQRVMVDVDNIDLSTRVLGQDLSMPLMLAPVGMAGMMAQRGEVIGSRAATATGIPFTLSTLGVCTLEEITAASGRAPWFQLYMLRDRDTVVSLLERARNSGCDTLLFTVDLPTPGSRYRDLRNGMVGDQPLKMAISKAYQLAARPHWVYNVGINGKPHTIGNLSDVVPDPTDLNSYAKWIEQQFDPTVTWKDIEWLRSIWPGKLVIKGVLEADDARAAVDTGADGVVVSNHGGRQLDDVASTISKLPEVVSAVGDQTTVLLDGGVRNGLDVLKAVALGADGVLIGRPWIWAAAGAGLDGLKGLLARFRREMEVGMMLTGVTAMDQLSKDQLDS